MKKKKKHFLAIILFLIFTFIFLFPLSINFNTHYLKSPVENFEGFKKIFVPSGDQVIFLWAFWWAKIFLKGGATNFFYTDRMNYPDGEDIVAVTLCPLLSFLSVPFQSFFKLTSIYNLYLFILVFLSAYLTFILALSWGASFNGAIIAGTIFSFSFFQNSHLYHLNLMCLPCVPFTLIFYKKLLDTPNLKDAFLTAIGVLLTTLSCWYIMVAEFIILLFFAIERWFYFAPPQWKEQIKLYKWQLFFIFTLFFILSMIFLTITIYSWFFIGSLILVLFLVSLRKKEARKQILFLCISAVIFLIISYPYSKPIINSYQAGKEFNKYGLDAKTFFSLSPIYYILPPEILDTLAKIFLKNADEDIFTLKSHYELRLFPGYLPLIFLVVLLFDRRKKSENRLLFFMIVFFILSLGPIVKIFNVIICDFLPNRILYLPGTALHFLPITAGIRVFARFGVWVLFFLALYIGLNWEIIDFKLSKIFKKFKYQNYHKYFFPLLLILIFVEPLRIPIQTEKTKVPEIINFLKRLPERAVFIEIPLDENIRLTFLQTQHNHTTVNSFFKDLEIRDFSLAKSSIYPFFLRDESMYKGDNGRISDMISEKKNFYRGLIKTGADYIVIYSGFLSQSRYKSLESFFEKILGLTMIYESDEGVVFKIPPYKKIYKREE